MVGRVLHLRISGRVQGVGYRAWLQAEALSHGLSGWVRNRRDGSVEAVASGPEQALDALLAACRRGPTPAIVDAVSTSEVQETVSAGFEVRPTA